MHNRTHTVARYKNKEVKLGPMEPASKSGRLENMLASIFFAK
jgi:hypothetical protein